MLSGFDLIGLAMVCATVIAVFVLRGMFRDEIDDLNEGHEETQALLKLEQAKFEALDAKVEDLAATVRTNANTLALHARALTGGGLKLIGGAK